MREVDEYIASGSPFYSIIFIDKLITAVEKVGAFPMCGRVVPEFEIETLREVIFYDYRIVYLLRNNKVIIIAVVHGAMDIIKKRERETWDIT